MEGTAADKCVIHFPEYSDELVSCKDCASISFGDDSNFISIVFLDGTPNPHFVGARVFNYSFQNIHYGKKLFFEALKFECNSNISRTVSAITTKSISGCVVTMSPFLYLKSGITVSSTFSTSVKNHLLVLTNHSLRWYGFIHPGYTYTFANIKSVSLKEDDSVDDNIISTQVIRAYFSKDINVIEDDNIPRNIELIHTVSSTISIAEIKESNIFLKDVHMHNAISIEGVVHRLDKNGWIEFIDSISNSPSHSPLYSQPCRLFIPHRFSSAIDACLRPGAVLLARHVYPLYLWSTFVGFAATIRTHLSIIRFAPSHPKNILSSPEIHRISNGSKQSNTSQFDCLYDSGKRDNVEDSLATRVHISPNDVVEGPSCYPVLRQPPECRSRCVVYCAWRALVSSSISHALQGGSFLAEGSPVTSTAVAELLETSSSLREDVEQAHSDTFQLLQLPRISAQRLFVDPGMGPLFTVRAGKDGDWLSSLLPQIFSCSEVLGVIARSHALLSSSGLDNNSNMSAQDSSWNGRGGGATEVSRPFHFNIFDLQHRSFVFHPQSSQPHRDAPTAPMSTQQTVSNNVYLVGRVIQVLGFREGVKNRDRHIQLVLQQHRLDNLKSDLQLDSISMTVWVELDESLDTWPDNESLDTWPDNDDFQTLKDTPESVFAVAILNPYFILEFPDILPSSEGESEKKILDALMQKSLIGPFVTAVVCVKDLRDLIVVRKRPTSMLPSIKASVSFKDLLPDCATGDEKQVLNPSHSVSCSTSSRNKARKECPSTATITVRDLLVLDQSTLPRETKDGSAVLDPFQAIVVDKVAVYPPQSGTGFPGGYTEESARYLIFGDGESAQKNNTRISSRMKCRIILRDINYSDEISLFIPVTSCFRFCFGTVVRLKGIRYCVSSSSRKNSVYLKYVERNSSVEPLQTLHLRQLRDLIEEKIKKRLGQTSEPLSFPLPPHIHIINLYDNIRYNRCMWTITGSISTIKSISIGLKCTRCFSLAKQSSMSMSNCNIQNSWKCSKKCNDSAVKPFWDASVAFDDGTGEAIVYIDGADKILKIFNCARATYHDEKLDASVVLFRDFIESTVLSCGYLRNRFQEDEETLKVISDCGDGYEAFERNIGSLNDSYVYPSSIQNTAEGTRNSWVKYKGVLNDVSLAQFALKEMISNVNKATLYDMIILPRHNKKNNNKKYLNETNNNNPVPNCGNTHGEETVIGSVRMQLAGELKWGVKRIDVPLIFPQRLILDAIDIKVKSIPEVKLAIKAMLSKIVEKYGNGLAES